MAELTQAAYEAKYNSSGSGNFPDNTTQLITPSKVREFAKDTADTFYALRVFTSKISISSAEILNIFTVPKELVAAPGAGKMINPIAILFVMDYNTTTYSAANSLKLAYDDGVVPLTTHSGYLSQANDYTATFSLGTSINSISSYVNKNYVLTATPGNPVTGNSPIILYVTYSIITL